MGQPPAESEKSQTAATEVRIAFAIQEWLGWIGGINYHRNLLRAVVAEPSTGLRPLLITGSRTDRSVFTGFPDVPTVRSAIFDRPGWPWALRAVGRRVRQRDRALERLLGEHDISVLSHTSQAWSSPDIAMLGWIADFQHRRLSDLFSRRERNQRDRPFARICRRSTLVVVSSASARADLAAFAPEFAGRARVLHFVTEPPPAASLPSESEIAGRYGVDRDYFYVPNQFWVHKNHGVVIDALKRMRDRGIRPLVIATGERRDYRKPEYFDSLVRAAESAGITEMFRPIGVVPYPDVVALMRGALAVVNPSRSEGWSTSVEEAKSLGKRVLLSDIAVHREQDPDGGIFFDPHDGEALAEAMTRLLEHREPEADAQLKRRAKEALPARQANFAREYADIVHEAHGLVRGVCDS